MKPRSRPRAGDLLGLARGLLLALFLLLAQAGALTHGVSHILDPLHGHEPACEQCLAYAAMAAGMPSTPLDWSPPAQTIPYDAPLPAASPTRTLLPYQSRAPPTPNC